MVGNVLEEDLQALEANGRILQEKLATGDLSRSSLRG